MNETAPTIQPAIQPAAQSIPSDELQLTPEFRSKPIRLTVTADVPFTINHELGRVPAGWLVIDSTEPVDVWRSGAMDTAKLELSADRDSDITLVLL